MENKIRQALLGRTPTIGTWIQMGHASAGEILANAGFDWIAVDCEHTDIALPQLATVFRGIHGRGAAPFVRVRENDTLAIRQVLDLGAQGVIVPLVNTAAEAEAAVAAAKYPPVGKRGYAFCRANDHGVDFDEYVRRANDEIVVVVMIESREAVENIDSIIAVKGVDGVFIGPYDLSGSYGIPGRTMDKEILQARRRILDACSWAGKSAGLHVVIPDEQQIEQAIEDGFTFLALAGDTIFLNHAARQALGPARRAIRRKE